MKIKLIKEIDPKIYGKKAPFRKTRMGIFLCYCGKEFISSLYSVNSKHTKSCGCYKIKTFFERNFKNGYSKKYKKEYSIWAAIKQRCYNSNHIHFKNYGGRNIKVCERWFNSFENFLEDMKPITSKNHSIDRIDTNGNYEPLNCRWATSKEQANNKRNNIVIKIDDVSKILKEWTIEFNISVSSVVNTVKRSNYSYKDSLLYHKNKKNE